MRLSLTWTAQPRKFAPLILTGDFAGSVETANSMGYQGIEMSIRTAYDISATEVIGVIKKYGVQVSAVSTGLAYVEDGLSLVNEDKEIRQNAEVRFKEQIAFASAVQSDNVIFGLLRGKLSEKISVRQKQQEWIKTAMKSCAAYAENCGVNISIEPINRYETNYLNTMAEAVAFIGEVGMDNLYVMADTFHMNIEEKNTVDCIARYKDKISYVHLADSNRQIPGNAHIDFPAIINALKHINYSGFLSLECLLIDDPAKEAMQAHRYLSTLFNSQE
ncbi:MAG: sugar phosphate isomerase/epimerase family protein [Bacillota bacterium]|nr:sugar phosphate isomerase/epimerase family protein [Bacillota bacterium]